MRTRKQSPARGGGGGQVAAEVQHRWKMSGTALLAEANKGSQGARKLYLVALKQRFMLIIELTC